MADKEVSVAAAAAAGAQPSEQEKKRKLVDLEADAPEPLTGVDSESKADGEADEEKTGEEEADESELKRPRLEDKMEQSDGHASENGHKDKGDKLVEGGDEKVDEPPSVEKNDLADGDVQEQTQEAAAGQTGENEQPSGEDEKHTVENEENLPKGEVEEPSADVAEQTSGSEETSRKMDVPNNKVGVLIGKAGDTIRYLQYNSGAKIQITRDADADPRAATRPVELIGTLESIEKAEKLINDVIAEADAGGSPSLVARGFSTVQAVVGDQIEIQVPNEKVGLIIGKGGETIKNLQTRSGARIQLVPQHLPAGDQSKERTVRVTGDTKQIEMATEMIKEVMNQLVRPSPLSGGYSRQAFRPRGLVAPQWGNRGPHPTQFMGYDYQQRGPYPSQNAQYAPTYGNYPPQQAPRNFAPGWEQRPPSAMQGPTPQANYNYGQPQGPDYVQPTTFSQTPGQSYGQGYNEMKYDSQVSFHHSYGGHGVSQPTGYHQGGGAHPSYGPQDQYGRTTSYGTHPQAPYGQTYGQPRPNQPGDMPYQAPVSSTQTYGSNVPPQQSYPYPSSGPMQQSYPLYGSAPTADGYSHPQPAAATGPGYPQQGGQPISGYGQQPSGYATGGPTTGYSSYPSQAGYTEQPAASSAAYGYQASTGAAYGSGTGSTYGALQPGYLQPAPTQPGYDQSNPQAGAYGTAPASVPAPAPAAAPAGYGKSLSPQPGYPQYDSSQMYGAPR